MKGMTLLDVLTNITEDNLAEVEAAITETEGRLVLLREARKICIARLHPDEVKKPGGGRPRKKRSDAGVTRAAPSANGNGAHAAASAPPERERELGIEVHAALEASGPLSMEQLLRQLTAAGVKESGPTLRSAVLRVPGIIERKGLLQLA